MKSVACSRKYLFARSVMEIGLTAALLCAVAWFDWIVALCIALLAVMPLWFLWKCRTMYRFAFGNGQIRTHKVFTNHVDISAPAHAIQSVAVYQGVVESICNAGTIEIDTSGTNLQNAKFVWPHLPDPDSVASELRMLASGANDE
ncbi:YdbT family protein [Crateriforma conspicua]|uniref:PH domain-containing protein n=1 Tax=Crateriforma conspicua TaxID=2527996 RepID=UPI0013FCF8D9|nr:PH domain-containing protein [Crateriforma conspicua]